MKSLLLENCFGEEEVGNNEVRRRPNNQDFFSVRRIDDSNDIGIDYAFASCCESILGIEFDIILDNKINRNAFSNNYRRITEFADPTTQISMINQSEFDLSEFISLAFDVIAIVFYTL